MADIFRFKQFSISQKRSAMKVGTDGVLLGAWTDLSHRPESILDVGAGTGLIALMLAQRSVAPVIDAVEIDADAYEEAVENFENSPWGDRLFCYHADFRTFYREIEEVYDLIISNPPYFEEPSSQEMMITQGRRRARFTSALSFQALFEGVGKLLAPNGKWALIAPRSAENSILQKGTEHHLYLQRRLRVRGRESTPVKRSLLLFGWEKESFREAELILEITRHRYTQEYQALTKDFYLDV